MDLQVAPKHEVGLQLVNVNLAVDGYLIYLICDHVEVVVAEFQVLPPATDVQVLDEFISPNNQHPVLLQYFDVQFRTLV